MVTVQQQERLQKMADGMTDHHTVVSLKTKSLVLTLKILKKSMMKEIH
jgi:hypothetical protein